jgi:competence ComEA-like helix-hairpin-helix protein
MKWRTVVVDYFTFTKRERIGVLVLICLIALIFLLPPLLRNQSRTKPPNLDTSWMAALKNAEVVDSSRPKTYKNFQQDEDAHSYTYDRTVNSSPSLKSVFPFDPNTLSEAGWRKLGIKDKTISTIRNYLQKGGRFFKAADLKRIYGLRPDDFARLEPYVSIEASPTNSSAFSKKEFSPGRAAISPVDINQADTSALIALPGIGNKLAARIVSFREKLGGFYSVDQIGEVYGLADSVFQKIKRFFLLGNTSIKRININTASVDEMKMHPYIRQAMAKQITAYREEHGQFKSVADLRKIQSVTEEIFKKLAPYLVIE